MSVRPFRLLGVTTLRALDAKANEAIKGWIDAWFVNPPASSTEDVGVRPADDDTLPGLVEDRWWKVIGPQHWVALYIPTGVRRVVAEGLHGFRPAGAPPDSASSLSQQLLNRAFLDLGQRLLRACGVGLEDGAARIMQQSPPPSVWAAGSGATMTEIQVGEEKIVIVLPAELTTQAPAVSSAQTQPLVARSASLDSQRVCLRAWVGNAELTLYAMQTLRVGDVIRLDCAIDQLLRVVPDTGSQEERPLARGYLGTADGDRAVQLVWDS